MKVGSGEAPACYGRRVRRVVAGGVAVALLLLASFTYLRVGWTRMESACGADPAGSNEGSDIRYSWSWRPLGFHCAFDDGGQRTSLWF